MSDDYELVKIETLRHIKCCEVCIKMFEDRGYTVKTDKEPVKHNWIIGTNNGHVYLAVFNRDGTGNLKKELKDFNTYVSAILRENDLDVKESQLTILYFYKLENHDFHKKPSVENKSIPDNIIPYCMSLWCVNPTLHELQPKFTLIKKGSEEYNKFFESGYDKSCIPKFCIDDPIVRYYDAKHDDLFKIQRVGQETLTYRIVSSRPMNLIKT